MNTHHTHPTTGQPYCVCDKVARDFATRHGLLITIRCKAPWAPGVMFYQFNIPANP